MAISTNAIFHFTNSIEVLEKILLEGFKIKYCTEILHLGIGFSKMAHPMVSFCDIPLSLCKKHVESYGGYGIGLKKEWAFANKINPVLYIDRHSIVAESLRKLLKKNAIVSKESSKISKDPSKVNKKSSKVNKKSSKDRNIIMLKCCMKNYSGEISRCGVEKKDYRYYDEREWRFIPDKDKDKRFIKCKSPLSLCLDDYQKNKEIYNQQISSYRLKFTPNDIEYIIVKSKDECSEMIEFLRENYSCSNKELNILFSKIRTIQELECDF